MGALRRPFLPSLHVFARFYQLPYFDPTPPKRTIRPVRPIGSIPHNPIGPVPPHGHSLLHLVFLFRVPPHIYGIVNNYKICLDSRFRFYVSFTRRACFVSFRFCRRTIARSYRRFNDAVSMCHTHTNCVTDAPLTTSNLTPYDIWAGSR